MTGKRLALTQEELFLRHVYPEPNTGCWLWGGTADPKTGYGHYRFREGRYRATAHRASWLMFVGSIPDSCDLHHTCHVRLCVNPEHLTPLTRRDHMHEDGRLGKPHCHRGHAFTPENTWIEKNGARHCRRCHRETQRLYIARRV